MNPSVDWYFKKPQKWQLEIEQLRQIALSCDVVEELKWGCPCYTLNGSNVFLIHVFKDYCALLFHKGALLKDPKSLLIQQTPNVQVARQMRFTSLTQILDLSPTIKKYITEAIKVEKSGLQPVLKETQQFAMPDEFKTLLDSDKTLKNAFEKLTPGRQRAYLLFFSAAKQSKTRQSRIEKVIPKILKGKGLDDV